MGTYLTLTYENMLKVLKFQAVYEGATAPTLLSGEARIWKNTDTGKYYHMYSPDGVIKLGVEMCCF